MRILLLIAFLIVASCSQKPANIVINETHKNSAIKKSGDKNPFIITIKNSDTLYKIARQHGVGIRELIEKNRLVPPYMLTPGNILRLPQATFHSVKKGDTIYAISRSYGLDLGRLVHANNLQEPYTIKNGMRLRLPSPTETIRLESYTISLRQNAAINSNTAVKIANNDIPDNTAARLRRVISNDLGLIDRAPENPNIVLPNNFKIDRGAPYPNLRSSSYPAPNLKPGTKLSASKAYSQYNTASYSAPSKALVQSRSGFIWPTRGRVISRFGPKQGGLHNDGINISAKENTQVLAANDGKVVYVGNELRGYGNLLLIKHNNGYLTAYAHNKSISVKKGDKVKQGQGIARIGKTGHISTPQLHFSIRKGRKAINPVKYLPRG